MQGIKLNESLPEKRGRYVLSAVDCYIDLSPEFVIFLDFVGGKNAKDSMLWCILPTFIYPPNYLYKYLGKYTIYTIP